MATVCNRYITGVAWTHSMAGRLTPGAPSLIATSSLSTRPLPKVTMHLNVECTHGVCSPAPGGWASGPGLPSPAYNSWITVRRTL